VVKRFGLRRGQRVLEVACGSGFHTHLFNRMGFDCVGVDRSPAGIEWAKSHYPKWTYHCCDLHDMPVAHDSFDVVLARGCSHYHYHLFGRKALHTTAVLLRYLKPGGIFIMIIATDLSGSRKPDRHWDNTIADYQRHFSLFGDHYTVDWVKGMVICGLYRDEAVTPQVVMEQGAATPAVGL
jgi:SAM-dependent methyltransferase